MKIRKNLILAATIFCIFMFQFIHVDNVQAAGTNGTVETFIDNLYLNVQGRPADAAGKQYWCNQLTSKTLTAAQVAKEFLFSSEFIGKNTTNDEYVVILYKSLQNRTPDAGGQTYWTNLLNSSYSRLNVLAQIIDSPEFRGYCDSYNVASGKITLTDPVDLYPNLVAFVNRNYNSFLNRTPDYGGLNYYVGMLANKQLTAAQLVDSLVSSDEFKNSQVTSNDYLARLYGGLMGRSADQGGLNYWLNYLFNGYSRRYILSSFINSPEFTAICSNYNVNKGSISTTNKDIPYTGVVFGFANTDVNFRSGPSVGSSKIDFIPSGSKVVIVGRNYDYTYGYNFYQVRWIKGTGADAKLLEGYCVSNYVDVVADDVNNSMLGSLSSEYESNDNPGCISTWDTVGGASYGAWQFAQNTGSLDAFLIWLKTENSQLFNALDTARKNDSGNLGTNFNNTWVSLAKNNYTEFYTAQHKFAKLYFYDPLITKLRNSGDYDERLSSYAVRNTLWSTAIQHGISGANYIISKFKNTTNISDFINSIYTERSRVDAYFYSQPDSVKAALVERFKKENATAQRIYNYEVQYVNK